MFMIVFKQLYDVFVTVVDFYPLSVLVFNATGTTSSYIKIKNKGVLLICR